MPQSAISIASETGTAGGFTSEKGFGFILLDGGNRLFYHISRLHMIGLTSLAEGTPVTFYRGSDATGRPMVERFLEVAGLPKTAHGLVVSFKSGRGFGIAKIGNTSVLFHINQRGTGTEDAFVACGRNDELPIPKEGDGILLWIVAGNSGMGWTATRWILVPHDGLEQREPEAAPPAPGAAIKTTRPKPEFLPPRKVNCPAMDEWVKVIVRKIRLQRTSYGQSGVYREIDIPWDVIQRADIDRLERGKHGDWFEVKCKMGRERPAAVEIRRSSPPK